MMNVFERSRVQELIVCLCNMDHLDQWWWFCNWLPLVKCFMPRAPTSCLLSVCISWLHQFLGIMLYASMCHCFLACLSFSHAWWEENWCRERLWVRAAQHQWGTLYKSYLWTNTKTLSAQIWWGEWGNQWLSRFSLIQIMFIMKMMVTGISFHPKDPNSSGDIGSSSASVVGHLPILEEKINSMFIWLLSRIIITDDCEVVQVSSRATGSSILKHCHCMVVFHKVMNDCIIILEWMGSTNSLFTFPCDGQWLYLLLSRPLDLGHLGPDDHTELMPVGFYMQETKGTFPMHKVETLADGCTV